MKTITGREISVKANHKNRTFTIRTDSNKYRTIRLPKEEFENCLYNSANDWQDFLKSDDYYRVK